MIKRLVIFVFLLMLGCGSTPREKQDIITTVYPECEILYQKNNTQNFSKDFFLILYKNELLVVNVKWNGWNKNKITSELKLHGFEIKEKISNEIINDLQNVINKY